jgi:hypothetical protein
MGFSLQCMIFSIQLEGTLQLMGLFIWNYCNEVTIFSIASQVRQRVYVICHYLTIAVYETVVATAILTVWHSPIFKSDTNCFYSILHCVDVYCFVHCLRHNI